MQRFRMVIFAATLVATWCLHLPAASTGPQYASVQGESKEVAILGTLPRLIKITNTVTGVNYSYTWQTKPTLNVSGLPAGNFIVRHALPGQAWEILYVDISPRVVLQTNATGKSIVIDKFVPTFLTVRKDADNTVIFSGAPGSANFSTAGLELGTYTLTYPGADGWTRTVKLKVVAALDAPDADLKIFDNSRVYFSWSQMGTEVNYFRQTEDSQTGKILQSTWTQQLQYETTLPPGRYQNRVAISGKSYRRINFAIYATSLSLKFEYKAPGQGLVYWAPISGVSNYLVRIRNATTGTLENQYWVTTEKTTLNLQPQRYTIEVAISGQSPLALSVNLSDFTQSGFTPLGPIGLSDRQSQYFSWFPISNAIQYQLEVQKSDGTPVASSTVTVTEAQVLNLAPGAYRWRVVATNTLGQQSISDEWVDFAVSATPIARENLLGIPPDLTVPKQIARMNYPQDAVKTGDGTIYITDSLNHVIRRVSNGRFELFAGQLELGYNGDGFRTAVKLNAPSALTLDANGDLIFADSGNYLLRKLELSTGNIVTIAGQPGLKGYPVNGSLATAATLEYVSALDWDTAGNLYITMHNGTSGGVSQLAADGKLYSVNTAPLTLNAGLRDINITAGFTDYLQGNTLYRVDSGGTMTSATLVSNFGGGILFRAANNTTLVGSGSAIYQLDASLNKTTFASGFANVTALKDTGSSILVCDSDVGAVQEISYTGQKIPGQFIGPSGSEGISTIVSTAKLDADNLLFLENKKGYVYQYTISTGRRSIFAGNGQIGWAVPGRNKYDTPFYFATSLAVDSLKNAYIVENNRIVKIDQATGNVSIYAGAQTSGDTGEGGPAINALFYGIRHLVAGPDDALYVSDTYNNKIKRIGTDGIVTTLVGTGQQATADLFEVSPLTARLNHPYGVYPAVDGSLLICDSWNSMIVAVGTDNLFHHWAGVPQYNNYQGFRALSGDEGPKETAEFSTPNGITLAGDGRVFIADTFNHRIRTVDESGIIHAFWGTTQGYAADGTRLNFPGSMAIVNQDLYLVDSGNGLASRFRIDVIDALLTQP